MIFQLFPLFIGLFLIFSNRVAAKSPPKNICKRELERIVAQPSIPAVTFFSILAEQIRLESRLWLNPATQAQIAIAYCNKYQIKIHVFGPFAKGTKYPEDEPLDMKPTMVHYRTMVLNTNTFVARAQEDSSRFDLSFYNRYGQFLLIELIVPSFVIPLQIVPI